MSSPTYGGSPQLTPEEFWDLHGTRLFAMACTLVRDQAEALLAVSLGLIDLFEPSEPDLTLGSAARLIYRECCLVTPDEASQRASDSPPLMAWLGEVGQFQRSAMALCVFGRLTYREAAEELGVPPVEAAQLLISGLRELGTAAATLGR